MLHDYSPEVFNSLETLGNAYTLLGEEEKLSVLGDIILKYRLENVVGLCLLHRHVELKLSERLVERFDIEKIFIEPIDIEKEDVEKVPYSFKLTYNENLGTCEVFPIEFALSCTSLVDEYTETFLNKDGFINDITQSINNLGLTETIGITSLHHKALLLKNENETIEERTDHETRIHYLGRLEKIDDNWRETHINTLWTFNLTVNRNCNQACNKLCTKSDWHC